MRLLNPGPTRCQPAPGVPVVGASKTRRKPSKPTPRIKSAGVDAALRRSSSGPLPSQGVGLRGSCSAEGFRGLSSAAGRRKPWSADGLLKSCLAFSVRRDDHRRSCLAWAVLRDDRQKSWVVLRDTRRIS
ncbi:uncharacterized protein V3H82_022068 [Fundulus diaphanus]